MAARSTTTTGRPRSSSGGSRRGVVQRFTAKVGPLPVWAWALLILVAGYLVYRLTSKGSSTTSSTTDTGSSTDTATTSGDTGNPPASGQGGAADNVNSDLLSQLSGQVSGLAGNVDALTGLIQSTPAFADTGGTAGAGSDGSGLPTVTHLPAQTVATATTPTPARPRPRPPAPAHVRFYTYRPGQAPKGRKRDEAPAKGPAGTTLHFARGKGYYYA